MIGYSFVITIPSLLDRSISLYLLSSIVAAGKQGATPGQLDDWFYRGFVVRNGAVEKRLNEQRATGNVVLENGRYTATARGEITYTIYQNFVDLFNTDPRYVVPINEEAVLDASSSKSLEQ